MNHSLTLRKSVVGASDFFLGYQQYFGLINSSIVEEWLISKE